MKNRTFDPQFWRILMCFIILMAIFLSFPYLFTNQSWLHLHFSETGQIGDTIGGILSPFIAIAAAFLTFFIYLNKISPS